MVNNIWYQFTANKYFRSDPEPRSYMIDKIIKHPRWNKSTVQNDMCLLYRKEPIPYDAFVAPACLPDSVSNNTCSVIKIENMFLLA